MEAIQQEPKPMAQPLSAISIIHDRPPNFDEIHAVFPGASGEGVIFAYGDAIYNPSGQELPPEIIAHETEHCVRQMSMGVEKWWDRYLVDPDFRYDEELVAHRAEWKCLKNRLSSRQQRRAALQFVAKKLAAPLYGRMVTKERALKDIRGY